MSHLTSLSENLRATYTASKHQFDQISKIVKQRREHSTGKRVALKDQIILTTPEMYTKIQEAENATRQKQRKMAQNSATDVMNEVEDHT